MALQADTHRGDLAELDLRTLVSPQVACRTYPPVAADGLSGHHSAGLVTFDVSLKLERLVITIAPVRGMAEQRFEWQ